MNSICWDNSLRQSPVDGAECTRVSIYLLNEVAPCNSAVKAKQPQRPKKRRKKKKSHYLLTNVVIAIFVDGRTILPNPYTG